MIKSCRSFCCGQPHGGSSYAWTGHQRYRKVYVYGNLSYKCLYLASLTLQIYLQMRFTFKSPRLLRPFLQFVFLMMTFYTCLSRISDYKHHWSDVLSGFLLGTTVAILIVSVSQPPARPECNTYLISICNILCLLIWMTFTFCLSFLQCDMK